ncbi:MAG TPA: tripartite tricarboxylate transporter substrate-binding protein [Burkholderiaceae bacterium]|nr:tripartite tricarboxylate transporter substrate-binding protein [Burkholderiaceae bacterium]
MRTLLRYLALVVFAFGALPMAHAQSGAPPLVRLVVAFSPGGSNDVLARAIAPLLAKRLGNNVIVENKPGAAGMIGAEFVARAAPDGATLLLTSSTYATAAATQTKLPFDPATALVPVALLAQNPLLLAVSAATPYKSTADLVAAARAQPGKLNYGSAGVGSVGQMATELFSGAAKVQMTHVPFKGASDALLSLASGQIDVMISNYSSLAAQVKGGKVRALAVTSAKPSAAYPGLPAVADAVPGYAIEIWVAVFAPGGTPAPLVERFNREFNEIAASAELKPLFEQDGAMATPLSAAESAARISEDLAQWKRIATERKISVE